MAERARRAKLDRTDDAPSEARVAMESWLKDVLERSQLEDVKLLVSELVTNAVRHPANGDGIEIEVALARRTVRVVVTDPGSGFAKPRSLRSPPEDAVGGRGLLIVDRVASRWGVKPGKRTQVWFELDRR